MEYYKNVNELLNSKNIKKLNIKKYQIKYLEKLILKFNKKTIRDKYDMIKNLIIYDVKDKDWVDCISDSFKYKSGNASLESLIVRYGNLVGTALYEKRKKKYGITKEKYIEKYGNKQGELKWNNYCKSKQSVGKDIMIKRYGEDEGNERWKEYLKKWKKSIQIKKESGTWKANTTLKRYIEKYGEIDGKLKWDKYISYWKYQNSLKGYINKYGQEDGKKKWEQRCKKMDNSSLNYFQNKYGNKVGKKYYKENSKKHAITLEKMINKYGESLGEQKYNDWIYKITKILINNNTYSKISQELFWSIYNKLNDKSNINFSELNNEEEFFINKDWAKVIFVDFKKDNKIIEFDGDYWHKSNKQKKLDKKRDLFLKSKGYDILRIKEKEYKKNKEKILNECLQFLEDEK